MCFCHSIHLLFLMKIFKVSNQYEMVHSHRSFVVLILYQTLYFFTNFLDNKKLINMTTIFLYLLVYDMYCNWRKWPTSQTWRIHTYGKQIIAIIVLSILLNIREGFHPHSLEKQLFCCNCQLQRKQGRTSAGVTK